MTQDEIIEMANEAGITVEAGGRSYEQLLRIITRFAKLVAQHEREACAKICDDWPNGRDDIWEIGNAIRARGQA
jgi:hypothetical protein